MAGCTSFYTFSNVSIKSCSKMHSAVYAESYIVTIKLFSSIETPTFHRIPY